MRTSRPWCWVYVGCELTMGPTLGRIGAGAFDYDFGALDDAGNPLAESYADLMYDRLDSTSAI